MIDIFTVTNGFRSLQAQGFIDSINNYSDYIPTIIENGKQTRELKLSGKFNLIIVEEQSLANCWNICLQNSSAQWILISNDDCMALPSLRLLEKLAVETQKKMLFLSDYNTFSCFCVKREFIDNIGHFRTDFKTGYYEDCDWFLKAMIKTREHSADSFMNKYTYKQIFFKHNAYQKEQVVKRWDKRPNYEIFKKYWIEVLESKVSIQDKSSKHYIPTIENEIYDEYLEWTNEK